MELRHLRSFLAVADALHFRRAAAALDMAQPTLSLRVQQLERDLGADLFERVGRGVRLTEAGEVFRQHARRALAALDEARVALGELGGLLRGTLRLGVVQTAGVYLVPPVIAGFLTRHSGIQIRASVLSADGVEAGLRGGRLDLGISFVPAGDDMAAELLFDEELVLVVNEFHSWAGDSVPIARLDGVALTLMPDGFCTRRLAEAAFAEARARPVAAIELDTVEAAVATVRAGGPPGVLPALAVTGPGVRAVRLTDPTPTRSVGLLTRRDAGPLRLRAAFADAVRAAVPPRAELGGILPPTGRRP